MIRFCCEHCGHKISVQDKHVGKRSKCSGCGSVVAVPDKSTIIDFHCESCGRKISVPHVHAGKKGRCPKCKNIVVVPAQPDAPAKSVSTVRFTCSMCNQEIEEPGTSRGKLIECPHCSCYVAVPLEKIPAQKADASAQPGREDDISDESFKELQMGKSKTAKQEPELVTERKLPWILDIFLYPTSKAGLTTLAIIIVVPLLFGIVVRFLHEIYQQFPPMLVLLFPIVIIAIIVRFLLYLYLYWYFCECIRDSAAGGVRAPETLANTPGLGELLWQCFRTLVCLAVFAAPTLIYYGNTKQTDAVFWALLACGLFFFPMGLLAVVLFDSFSGLNTILLIGSIFSTFLPYFAMIVVFGSAVFLFIEKAPDTGNSLILAFVLQCVRIYLAMVMAHLLGWFFHHYEQELNWEV